MIVVTKSFHAEPDVSDDHNVYALNPDGSLLWSYSTGGKVESSPAIGADGTVYIGSDDRKLYAFGTE